MNERAQAAVEDLAVMRALVESRPSTQRSFGEAYVAGGLAYGVQMLLHAGQFLGQVPTAPPYGLAIGLGPTVIFLIVLSWIIWRHRKEPIIAPNDRAVHILFGVTGLANLALVAIIGSVALRHHSVAIWLIYPCAVFVLQGAGWMVAYGLRRHAWQALVALGWCAASIAMAQCIDRIAYFILIAGVSFLLLMVAPGAAVIALSRRSA